MRWQEAAKFWVALAYAVLIAVNQVLTPGTAQRVITVVLAALGAVTVYLVPNQPPAPPPAP